MWINGILHDNLKRMFDAVFKTYLYVGFET